MSLYGGCHGNIFALEITKVPLIKIHSLLKSNPRAWLEYMKHS